MRGLASCPWETLPSLRPPRQGKGMPFGSQQQHEHAGHYPIAPRGAPAVRIDTSRQMREGRSLCRTDWCARLAEGQVSNIGRFSVMEGNSFAPY